MILDRAQIQKKLKISSQMLYLILSRAEFQRFVSPDRKYVQVNLAFLILLKKFLELKNKKYNSRFSITLEQIEKFKEKIRISYKTENKQDEKKG